mmetsp:Transcript_44191/g.117044  ORF Transcript_44191/g.117044 Transcript_44191/m.117044 type:complete len:106 (+) Transcript_44191:783-1100(+)
MLHTVDACTSDSSVALLELPTCSVQAPRHVETPYFPVSPLRELAQPKISSTMLRRQRCLPHLSCDGLWNSTNQTSFWAVVLRNPFARLVHQLHHRKFETARSQIA